MSSLDKEEPVTLTFQFRVDDVWTDPDGVDWWLTRTDATHAHFERIATTKEIFLTCARTWVHRQTSRKRVPVPRDSSVFDALVDLYHVNAVAVADACDNKIDPSGALLGQIRSAHHARYATPPTP